MQLTNAPTISPEHARELAYEILFSAARDLYIQAASDPERLDEADNADAKMRELMSKHEIDVVFTIPSLARVRANLFLQRHTIGAALRIVPLRPSTIDQLGLPAVLKKVAMEPQGLVVITGPTGSGKTTTLAALVEEINRSRHANIFTIEDPIEYVFEDKKSVIHQREVGQDTETFGSALRSVMRQAPDVIAIGELRDREAIEVAITAAEIGHLVLTTLHTTSAAATVDRILNVFPDNLKRQVSQQLAASLLCVTSQRLLRRTQGHGRVAAVEVLAASPTVRKQLEDGDAHDLYTCIREGGHYGMNTLNQALEQLYRAQRISYDEAMSRAVNAAELRQMLRH
jgi:twitching motility protein PilT